MNAVRKIFPFFLCIFFIKNSNAQCSAFINSFPYNEGFENNMGNWFVTANSVNPDWAWGSPSKPVIKNAGGGLKCWITGGLTNSFYNDGEQSFLQSPCFDISSLKDPVIRFKIFWETENNYDGAGFQYSIDSGNSWLNLGSTSDAFNCADSNWFNASVRYLSTVEGWSGSVSDGNGSGKWLIAKHDLNIIKGAKTVVFRFAFGAGTRNNNYDGFAVDDIFIGEDITQTIDFSYSCKANNEVNFMSESSACNSSYSWDFGDASSGSNNQSNLQNPSHIFSSAGTYTITLNAGGTGVSKEIIIPDITLNKTDITCYGLNNGEASAVVSGNDSYTFSWNTRPVQTTNEIADLAAGIYTVTVSGTTSCTVNESVTIAEPDSISPNIKITNEICGNKKGSVSTNVKGGTSPYNFLWSNNENSSSINNLSAGNFSLNITDANNCKSVFDNIIVKDSITKLSLFLGNDTTFCPGNKLVLIAGNFADYLWQDNSSVQTFTVTSTGTYFVKVNDSNGCGASDTINVTVDCNDIFFPSAFTPNNDGRNDLFGPAGNIAAVKNYSFKIFNRWGQTIFSSTNPYQKWNGMLQNEFLQKGTFVWFASYSINNSTRFQKGTVIIIQ